MFRTRIANPKTLKVLLLLLVPVSFLTVAVFATQYGELATSSLYRHPYKWSYLTAGTTFVRASNFNGSGSVLVLGSTLSSNPSRATWQIAFPDYKSIIVLHPEIILIFPYSTWSQVPDSIARFYVNGFETDLVYNNATTIQGLGPVYGLNIKPDPSDHNAHIVFPQNALEPNNNITVVFPPYTVAYVDPVNLLADATSQSTLHPQDGHTVGLILSIVFVSFFFITLAIAYRYGTKTILVLTLGFATRFLIAPFTEHVFDIEVAKRTADLFFFWGSLDISTFSYGPLWIMTNVVFASPAFAIGSESDFLLNLLLKTPAILADGLVFLLLYSLLSRQGIPRARWIAMLGWLFNPLVFWTSSVHGMYSSIVGFFILSAIYLSRTRQELAALVIGVGGGFLPVIWVLVIPLLVAFRKKILSIVLLATAGILSTFLLPYSVYEEGINSILISPLFRNTVAGASVISDESYQYVLFRSMHIVATPLIGIIVATALAIGYKLRVRYPKSPADMFVIFVGVFLVCFYLTYPTLYFQHIVWVLPSLTLALTSMSYAAGRTVRIVLLLSSIFLLAAFTTRYILDALRALVIGPLPTEIASYVSTHVFGQVYPLGIILTSLEFPFLVAILLLLLGPFRVIRLSKIDNLIVGSWLTASFLLIQVLLEYAQDQAFQFNLIEGASMLLILPIAWWLITESRRSWNAIRKGALIAHYGALLGLSAVFTQITLSSPLAELLLITYLLLGLLASLETYQSLRDHNAHIVV